MRDLILICSVLFVGCASKSRIPKAPPVEYSTKKSSHHSNEFIEAQVVNIAKGYLNTPYQYGGTTSSGFDCSGLVWKSFSQIDITLPRTTKEQAKFGKNVKLKDVKKGDLIFFAQPGGRISHSGIVTSVNSSEILFIHSSSSKGVIISSLNEPYWNKRFVKSKRVF